MISKANADSSDLSNKAYQSSEKKKLAAISSNSHEVMHVETLDRIGTKEYIGKQTGIQTSFTVLPASIKATGIEIYCYDQNRPSVLKTIASAGHSISEELKSDQSDIGALACNLFLRLALSNRTFAACLFFLFFLFFFFLIFLPAKTFASAWSLFCIISSFTT